jgi:periplasmic glucans biosynthesis protein
MDSPSIAGALRIQIAPGGTQIMDIDTAFYPRKAIERLGIAPLTSMFFYGKNDRRGANDWRPEIHDSDGLSMWTGAGEWIWRPLTNPAQLHFNSYLDDNPRGFGLLQRDRNFDHYQDDGVYYDRRPSLWVEPRPGGTAGARAPCSWLKSRPSMRPSTTSSRSGIRPTSPSPGRNCCSATGCTGARRCRSHRRWRRPSRRAPASAARRTEAQYYSWHFAVDFAGGELGALAKDAPVEAVITTTSSGKPNT